MAEPLTIALILEARDRASEWIDKVKENVDLLAKQVEQSSKVVADSADQMSSAFVKTDEASTSAADSMDRESIAADRSAASMRDQARASEEATVKTDEQTVATKDLGTTSEESAGKMDLLNKASGAIGLALVGVAAVSVKMAASFQESTATLAGQAGITTQAANNIGNAFVAAGGQTTFTASEMMSAFAPISGEFVSMYGHALNATQSMTVMNAAMMLAEAGSGNLATSTKALADTLKFFHLGVNGASGAANILFNTSRLLGTSTDNLATSFQRLEPRIASSGMSLAQTSAFMLELSSSAGSGRTALRLAGTAISSLVHPSTTAQLKLAELGVNVDNSKGKFVGMATVIGELHQALAKLPATANDVAAAQKMYRLQTERITLAQEPQTKMLKSQETAMGTQISALKMSTQALAGNSVMQAIFGTSAGAMTAIIAGGVPAFEQSQAAISKQGAAAKAAAAKQKTFAGTMLKLKSDGESLMIWMGKTMLPSLTSAAHWLLRAANDTEKWAKKNPGLAKSLVGVTLGLIALIKIMQTATGIAGALGLAMDSNPVGAMVAGIILAAGTIAVIILKWKTLTKLISKLDTTPIGRAVVAFLGWIDPLTNIPIMFTQLKTTAVDAWHDIKSAWNTAKIVFDLIWGAIKAGAPKAWHAITHAFHSAGTWFNNNVVKPVAGFFKTLWDGLKSAAKVAWHGITSVWDAVARWFNNNVVKPVASFFKTLWDGLKSAAKTTWHGITTVWDAVARWFSNNVIKPIEGFFKTVWGYISSGASTAWHGVLAVWDTVARWFNNNVIQPIKNFFDGLWGHIMNGVNRTVGAVKGALSTVTSLANPVSDGKKLLHLIGLASGGLVTSPTLAMVGEAGPEMVIPLKNLPGGQGVVGGGGVSPLHAAALPMPNVSASGAAASSGTVININVTMAGQMYGDINQALTAMGRQLATIIVPGSGTRLSAR